MRPLGLMALLLALGAPAARAEVALEHIGDFTVPAHVASPPDDPSRLFVVELTGQVHLIKDGVVQTEPFLDLSSRVASGFGETGMTSIAFAPNYEDSGLFYVFFTLLTPGTTENCEANGDGPGDTDRCPPIRVEEYRRSEADPDSADPTSARVVLEIPHTRRRVHYGGQLAFGPDGLLYISTGDGGPPSDPSRDPQHLLGKLLRIDPRQNGVAPYTIPADNPFGNEVFAYGLRNPFRFSFDREGGDLVIADVGNEHWEEIDLIEAGTPLQPGVGFDFGWKVCEGNHAHPHDPGAPPCSTGIPPVLEYPHVGEPGCGGSVTGGFVLRDPGLEELWGRYVYADFCFDFVRSTALPPAAGDPVTLPTVAMPTSFGEDACGRVYVAGLGGDAGPSGVWRLTDGSPAPCPPPGGPGPGPGPGDGPSPGPVLDLRAPTLGLAGPLRQRLVPGGLRVRVLCDEPCRVRALGTLSLLPPDGEARELTLGEARRPLTAGVETTLRLPLGRKARRRVRRALASGLRARAQMTVRVRDTAGNLRVGARRIRLIR